MALVQREYVQRVPTLRQAHLEADPVAVPKVEPGQKQLILIVDDSADVASAMRRLLRRLGYETDVQTAAPEALDAFRNKPQA